MPPPDAPDGHRSVSPRRIPWPADRSVHTPDEVLLRRFGHVRAIGGALYLATVAVLFAVYGTQVWPMLIGAVVLAIVTTGFFMQSDAYPRSSVAVSVVADLVVLAGAVAFFGGAGSGMVLLYSIPVVSAGILLGPSSSAGLTVLGVVVAIAQFGAELAGLRPALVVTEDLGDRIAVLAVSIAGLASVGYLTGTYASRLHELLALSGADLAALRSSRRRRRTYVHAAADEIAVPLRELEGLADELEAVGEAATGPAREVAPRPAAGDVPAGETARRLAARLRISAAQLQAGVEMLADVAAMDTIRDTRPEPVLLARVVEDCLTALRPRLGDRPASVDVPPIRVVADRRGARRIVYNLIENVADHTPADTPFEVTVLAGAGRGIIVVADEGPGVDPARAGVLFDARPGDRRAVGLPLVRELAEAMGAEVRYERARGGGARFMVSFRLAPPAAAGQDEPTPAPAPVPPAPPPPG